MNFASDPSIERKISQMSRRVRWMHRELTRQGIDQTRVVINDNNGNPTTHAAFHFLVLGDSGTGRHRRHSPPRRIAERLLPHKGSCLSAAHGNVVYLVGAADQYRGNFLKPYRDWLEHGKDWKTISHQGLIFNKPFLPVQEIMTTTTSRFLWRCSRVSASHSGDICSGCTTSMLDGADQGRVKPT